jgi:hypothetical protein
MTKVMSCGCENVHQDVIHGKGRRVFNMTAKKDPVQFRCTVCGSTKGASGHEPVLKKKK